MTALWAFEFDLARCAELDIRQAVDRVADRFADEDLTTIGLSRNPGGHRDVSPEKVGAASDRTPRSTLPSPGMDHGHNRFRAYALVDPTSIRCASFHRALC